MYQLTEKKGKENDIDKYTCICVDYLQDTHKKTVNSGCQWGWRSRNLG